MTRRTAAVLCLIVAGSLPGAAGCALVRDLTAAPEPLEEPAAKALLAEVEPADLPPFADDAGVASLRGCAMRSLEHLGRLPPERIYTTAAGPVRVADLRRSLTLFVGALDAAPRPIDWRQLVGEKFRVLRAVPPKGVLFTGYYQPELRAARERSGRYNHPLYRIPEDLLQVDQREQCPTCENTTVIGRDGDDGFVPYYSRAEIDGYGVLDDQDLEIAWLEDPVDVFFLHVQGSGVLRFDDGTSMQVGFAASNGRPYRSIGKLMVDAGKVPLQTASLQTLQEYLRAHPQERDAILFANERYIFFRPVPVGPIGSFGVPLTPGRSIAVDPAMYPLGGLAWIQSQRPAEEGGYVPLQRFVCAQDAGAAIAGPGRVDVFWGAGVEAERIAGPMRSPGEIYVLRAR